MRAAPSTGAEVVTRLPNGENVRNLWCRVSEGGRWCKIATMADPGFEGWTSGDFLIEEPVRQCSFLQQCRTVPVRTKEGSL